MTSRPEWVTGMHSPPEWVSVGSEDDEEFDYCLIYRFNGLTIAAIMFNDIDRQYEVHTYLPLVTYDREIEVFKWLHEAKASVEATYALQSR